MKKILNKIGNFFKKIGGFLKGLFHKKTSTNVTKKVSK